MSQSDYRGARGSNAGDDFHELWVLRQALSLLSDDTGLTAIAVEGLRVEDEIGTSQDQWDGVDCTFYYGGDSVESANRIVVDQLKYSAANAEKPWTVSRLTSASNDKKDNSVIGRLAKAFSGLKKKRSDFIAGKHITLRLVSNQPIDPAVYAILLGQPTPLLRGRKPKEPATDRDRFFKASGLDPDAFEDFLKSIDFSFCENKSRLALDENIHTTISAWIDDDARTTVNSLMRFVRKAMMPEGRRDYITRQSIFAQLGFSDPLAIFPCPPEIKQLDHPILRDVAQTIIQMLVSNKQRLCIHGEGGTGKTTLLQDIKAHLPANSVMVIFDCYGGGRYLDTDAFRHRAQDAFLQLSNDLAREIRIPLFLNRSTTHYDYPRAFKKRLDQAAKVVAAIDESAVVVIVIDAADNALTAAAIQNEKCFVNDFLLLGDLPLNVRLLVSVRTGRLPMLELPSTFVKVELSGFTLGETAQHVHSIYPEASDIWIHDFHHLSRGNPRVQQYTFDIDRDNPQNALIYLLPHGKSLNHIFEKQFEYAQRKTGKDENILVFCAALIALPRPIPIPDLASVISLSEAHIHDLAIDLMPGLQITNRLVSFIDEDFEQFVRSKATVWLDRLYPSLADHFLKRSQIDSYAATHLASALLAAGRRQDIIGLIYTEPVPLAISDPLLQRETQLQRLRIAMKVCREAGKTVDILLILLSGAEALRTDTTIHEMLINNPDMTAAFTEQTSAHSILRNAQDIEYHGPLLFQMMVQDARRNNVFAVRKGQRQISAWLKRRKAVLDEKRKKHSAWRPGGWDISINDIASEIEAILRVEGSKKAVNRLLRLKPRSRAFEVVLTLSRQLITLGDTSLLKQVLVEIPIWKPWDLFVLVPLVLAGQNVDITRIDISLRILRHRGLIRLDKLKERNSNNESYAKYLDLVLTACEIVIAHIDLRENAIAILQDLADPQWRCYDQLDISHSFQIDICLRSYSILKSLEGQETRIQEFLVKRPADDINKKDEEENKQLSKFLAPLMPIYNVRAKLITRQFLADSGTIHLLNAATRADIETYTFDESYHAFSMRTQVALSLTKLLMLREFDRTVLFESVRAVVEWKNDSLNETLVKMYTELALDHVLHETILSAVVHQSKVIKSMKITTQEKLDAFLRFARLIMLISEDDARPFFLDAVKIANDVNLETRQEIALFAPFVKQGLDVLTHNQRRLIASQLAIVISDARTRLRDSDDFPWSQVTQAITTLDFSITLAAAGRWEDTNIVKYEEILPTILSTALLHEIISPDRIAAFTPLLNNFPSELMSAIIQKISSTHRQHIIETLARDELLRFGQGQRTDITAALRESSIAGFWIEKLMKAELFHKQESIHQPHDETLGIFGMVDNPPKTDLLDLLQSINRNQFFTSKEAINDVLEQVIETAREKDIFLYPGEILNHITASISLRDRVAYLELLSEGGLYGIDNTTLGEAIVYCLKEWDTSPAINHWCQTRLIHVIVRMLPNFTTYLIYGQSPLPMLLEKTRLPSTEIINKLLGAMEHHVDTFHSSTAFALVGLLGEYCTPSDAAEVSERYASRLVQRIPIQDHDQWNLPDIPISGSEAIARFLYTLMSDIEVHKRWRAAHTVRRLAQFHDSETINHLITLYDKKIELSYRNPDAPFYWLASRLWLVITMDRMATESPDIIAHHGEWLLNIATDKSFPHLLIRAFAKSAVLQLITQEAIILDKKQNAILDSATMEMSPILQTNNDYIHQIDLDDQSIQAERFSFDSIDTIPYWYSPAIRLFFDVGMKEFRNTAEAWIVDTWQVHDNPWEWDKEPRKTRITSSMSMRTMHRHGDLPSIERYHTYLEWHAMWCTIGQLIQTRSLAKNDDEDDDYYTLDGWIRRHGLAMPPFWLADLLGSKPLEAQFWNDPEIPIDSWVDSLTDQTFLNQIFSSDNSEMLVVDGDHNTHSYRFKQETQIRTALVSPDTALALARALQTVSNSWDYRIPYVEDELEINDSPYKLIGWLINYEHLIEGIDEHDPLRYGIRSIETYPGPMVEAALNLEFHNGEQLQWVNTKDHSTAFIYEGWGDTHDDGTEYTGRSTSEVRSKGWRLLINKNSFQTFLDEVQLDVIIEVEIIRENSGYGQERYNEPNARKTRRHRIFILRRDGTIDAAEGCVGTWKVSCS